MSTSSKEQAEAALPEEPILRLDPGMHTAPIKRIDVDAGGRYVVTGSDDRTARVWSLDDGRLLRTLHVPIGDGNVGKVYAVAISPDGEQVAAGGWGPFEGDSSVYIFGRTTGRMVHRVDGLLNIINHLAFSSDGRHLVAALGGETGIRVFETEAFRQVAEDPDYGAHSCWAAFDDAGRLVTTSYDGRVRLYDASFRLVHSQKAPGGEQPFGVAFSPDGKRIAVGYYDRARVNVLDGGTLEPLFEAQTLGVDNGNLGRVAWSADGRFLHAGGRWDKAGKSPVRRWQEGGRGAHKDFALSDDTIMDLRPLADGRLAFGSAAPAFGLLAPDGSILWRRDSVQADFRGQAKAFAISTDGSSVGFGFDLWGESPARFDLKARRLTLDPEPDPALATARTEAPGLEVESWEHTTAPTLNGRPLALERYETSRSVAIAPDGQRLLLGADWSLRLFDRGGEQLWQIPVPGVVWAVNVPGDGRLALAAFADGTIRWFRLDDGRKELLAFFPHQDRERWVAWTPQGYYMAAPGAEDLIGWHVNRGLDEAPEWYSAGRFRDRFHRPDVIALVLDELDVEKALARADREAGIVPGGPTLRSLADLSRDLPSSIEIIEPADGTVIASDHVQVSFLISGPVGERVPALSAHLNGQLVNTLAGPPVDIPAGGHRGLISVPLAGWLQSEEAVIALIAEGRRASDPVELRLRWVSRTVETELAKPALFVLAIGVSKYGRNPPDDLTYAAKDATDLAEVLTRQKAGYMAT